MKPGKVFLIGAGPGDPGLITLKGMSCIQKADVVIYDFLASPELLSHASASAQIIYVGKKGGDHTLPQNKINALIVEKAKQGLTVARLKGGDPFIFGRGGEEAEELVAAGIEFEIVPGVTSAIAAPAYAGIPLTHRDHTSTLAIVTGHEDPVKRQSGINWKALAQGIGTIVFLMGVKNLPEITRNLIDNGMSQDTPVALIRWGTTPEQETVSGTLKTIVDKVMAAGLKPPAVIVVGDVVLLRDRLKWFENKPLWGKRIIVTRAREQASDLVKRLSDLGALCLETPTIEVVPPQDFQPFDRAIENLSSFQWVVFTSVNGVTAFFDRLFLQDKDARSLGRIQTACIGPATAARLLSFGVKRDIVPESYRAESIIEAFSGKDIRGQKILLPRAEQARPILPVELSKMGAHVDEITAYSTRPVPGQAEAILDHLENKTADLITFTSSSTVTNFKSLVPEDRFPELMDGLTVACIGPITAQTAEKLGFKVDIVAETYTIEGLCDALLAHYKQD
jgi:uroporphyrinogen III methyltransferase / synthase